MKKILKNNAFLVGFGVFFVAMLTIICFSNFLSVKETYSSNILRGKYKWNDFISVKVFGKLDYSPEFHFISAGRSFNGLELPAGTIYYSLMYLSDENSDDGDKFLWLMVGGNSVKVDSDVHYSVITTCADGDMGSITPCWDNKYETPDIMYIDEEVNIDEHVSYYSDLYGDEYGVQLEMFWNWFKENTTPYNQCYYNAENDEYLWNNLPSSGELVSGLTSQDSCLAKTPYTVTFDSNGGIIANGGSDSVKIVVNSFVELPDISKNGYIFDGWLSAGTDSIFDTDDDELFSAGDYYYLKTRKSVTLRAMWTEKRCNVLVNSDNLSIDDNYIFVNYGTKISDLKNNISYDGDHCTIAFPEVANENIKAKTGDSIYVRHTGDAANLPEKYIIAVLGDVNADGKITTKDFSDIYLHLKGISYLTGERLKAANYFNSDTKVSAQDLLKLFQYLKETYNSDY